MFCNAAALNYSYYSLLISRDIEMAMSSLCETVTKKIIKCHVWLNSSGSAHNLSLKYFHVRPYTHH